MKVKVIIPSFFNGEFIQALSAQATSNPRLLSRRHVLCLTGNLFICPRGLEILARTVFSVDERFTLLCPVSLISALSRRYLCRLIDHHLAFAAVR